jgi:hypothetical protein
MSMTRSLERSARRDQYRAFCEAWRREKGRQRELFESGEALPSGTNRLGRRPTFAMWVQAVVEQPSVQMGGDTLDSKQVQVDDAGW